MTGCDKTRLLAGTVMVYNALLVSPGTHACMCVFVHACSSCAYTGLVNFCSSVSGGHCLVAGSTQWVTKVSVCLIPHFLFRPTGTGGEEGGGRSGRGGGTGG